MKVCTHLVLYTLELQYISPLGNKITEQVKVAASIDSDALAYGHECQKKIWKTIGNVSCIYNIVRREKLDHVVEKRA